MEIYWGFNKFRDLGYHQHLHTISEIWEIKYPIELQDKIIKYI